MMPGRGQAARNAFGSNRISRFYFNVCFGIDQLQHNCPFARADFNRVEPASLTRGTTIDRDHLTCDKFGMWCEKENNPRNNVRDLS